jgi:hypothetical protein
MYMCSRGSELRAVDTLRISIRVSSRADVVVGSYLGRRARHSKTKQRQPEIVWRAILHRTLQRAVVRRQSSTPIRRNFDLSYETSGWQNARYVNNPFLDGMTHDKLVTGRLAVEQRPISGQRLATLAVGRVALK